MQNISPSPLKITLGFSTWLAAYLLVSHLSALALVLLLEPGIAISFGLVALILFSLVYHWRHDLLHLGCNSVIGIDWSNHGGWLLRQNSGANLKTVLSPTSFTSPYIVVLHFITPNSRRRMIAIAGDAIDGDQLRRLRVLLKMHNHFGL